MPTLDHAGIYVSDLDRTVGFWVEHLGATAGEPYAEPSGLRGCYVQLDGGGRLEILQRPDVTTSREGRTLGWAHVALHLGSREAVDAFVRRAADAGIPVPDWPEEAVDGTYEAVVLDPDGNQVELIA